MLCRDSACSGMDGTALCQVQYCSDSTIPLFFFEGCILLHLWGMPSIATVFFSECFYYYFIPTTRFSPYTIYLSILRSYLCYNGYVVPSKLTIVYILVSVLAIFSPLPVCMWWIQFSIILLHPFNIKLLNLN
jgi:hypothetical protein